VRTAADTLHNCPSICRKSYVLPEVVDAFAEGALSRFAKAAKRGGRSPLLRAALLAAVIQEKSRLAQRGLTKA
jgi:DNA topoisomerase I